jgi:hypothetical protein
MVHSLIFFFLIDIAEIVLIRSKNFVKHYLLIFKKFEFLQSSTNFLVFIFTAAYYYLWYFTFRIHLSQCFFIYFFTYFFWALILFLFFSQRRSKFRPSAAYFLIVGAPPCPHFVLLTANYRNYFCLYSVPTKAWVLTLANWRLPTLKLSVSRERGKSLMKTNKTKMNRNWGIGGI